MNQPSSSLKILIPIILIVCLISAALATPEQAKTQPQEFYRYMLGEFEITVLLDKVGTRDPATIANQPEQVKEALSADRIEESTSSCVSAFLIHTGDRLVLVDSGMGGDLVKNLIASGYQPEDIDTVLLTHMHPDHCIGLSKDDNSVFPNAEVMCDKREAGYWLDSDNATSELRSRFETIQSALAPAQDAGKLTTFDGSKEIVPGIRSVSSFGHTPGHTAYLVQSGGKGLLLWGDTVHIPQAQFENPSLTVKYDSNPDQAAEARLVLLELADSKGYLIGSPHISFPGLGQVRSTEDGYRWIPLPYGTNF